MNFLAKSILRIFINTDAPSPILPGSLSGLGVEGDLGIRISESFPAVGIGQPELKSLALCELAPH